MSEKISVGQRPAFTPPPPPPRNVQTDITVAIQNSPSSDETKEDRCNDEPLIGSENFENNSLAESDVDDEDYDLADNQNGEDECNIDIPHGEDMREESLLISAPSTVGTIDEKQVKANATKKVHSMRRNIDSQRAKNALNQFESDGEYEEDNYDELFSRRSSLSAPTFISPSTPLDNPSKSIKEKTSVTINNYGVRVPKIKRGVVELQSQRLFRSWKKRYFHLERGSVIFFEPLHWFQEGDFELTNLKIATELKPEDDVDVTIRLQSSKYPDICFKCHSPASKARWIKAFLLHIQYANEMKVILRNRAATGSGSKKTQTRESLLTVMHTEQKAQAKRSSTVTIALVPSPHDDSTAIGSNDGVNPLDNMQKQILEVIPVIKPVVDKDGFPTIHTGWLEKKGQWFPTIRRRFFLLFDGMLSYYRCEWDVEPYCQQARKEYNAELPGTEAKIVPPRALGKFIISNYHFDSDFQNGRVEITLYPTIASPSRRIMVVYCNDFMERDSWMRHFRAHADYNRLLHKQIK